MANISERVFDLIKDTVEGCGVSLWDVRFVKEGASHYLRVFIDKPDGICIDDCTAVSHAIDPIIDTEDPIDVSYYLEVCSPGLNRELSRKEHFIANIGNTVKLKLYKGFEGSREFEGILSDYDGGITVTNGERSVRFEKNEFSRVTLCDTDFQ